MKEVNCDRENLLKDYPEPRINVGLKNRRVREAECSIEKIRYK